MRCKLSNEGGWKKKRGGPPTFDRFIVGIFRRHVGDACDLEFAGAILFVKDLL